MSLMFGMNHLRGKTVMVVEDEALLALDISLGIEDAGASVLGPIYRMDQALQIRSLEGIDAAILDVDVNGQEVFPLADRLEAAGIPFVFHTGRRNLGPLRQGYSRATVLRKPCLTTEILAELDRIVAGLAPAPAQAARSISPAMDRDASPRES